MARSSGYGKADRFSEELLEGENDRLMDGMASKVSSLKNIAIDLRSEARDQVKIVDNSGGLFVAASSLLSSSLKKVHAMRRTKAQNCKTTCYFSLVAIALLFLAYLLIDKVVSR